MVDVQYSKLFGIMDMSASVYKLHLKRKSRKVKKSKPRKTSEREKLSLAKRMRNLRYYQTETRTIPFWSFVFVVFDDGIYYIYVVASAFSFCSTCLRFGHVYHWCDSIVYQSFKQFAYVAGEGYSTFVAALSFFPFSFALKPSKGKRETQCCAEWMSHRH